MEQRELNCATIGVANRMNISGRATAEETNRGLRIGKGRRLQRIACSSFPGSLIVASLFVVLTPMPARAEENEREIRKVIEALEAKVTSVEQTVSALQNEIDSLKTTNATLQSQLVAVQSNHALALGPFVRVDPNPEIGVAGPNIIFSGANIHIVSGSGSTDDNGTPLGLGNLIIGYNEDPQIFLTSALFTTFRSVGSENRIRG